MVQTLRMPGTADQVSEGTLHTAFGDFDLRVYRITLPYAGGLLPEEHLALVKGDPARTGEPVLCRVNSACITSEVFGCQRCDCKWQLDRAMEAVAAEGQGVITYHSSHEGQGHGLAAKLSAYSLMDEGVDRTEVYQRLGLATDDVRDYRAAAAILTHLGVASVVLLSNNARKAAALRACGITVTERRPLVYDGEVPAIRRYLSLKAGDPHHDLLRASLQAQP